MTQKVSIMDVAQKSGLSRTTVSRALNNSYGISEETKRIVLKAAEELKFKPNASARYLRMNKNNLLGILIPIENGESGITHPVYSEKISGIVKKANEMDYDVVIFIEDIKDYQRIYNIIKEKGLAGILFMERIPVEFIEYLRSYDIPSVQINWYISGYQYQHYLMTDQVNATIMALDYFLEKGYTDIGIINCEDILIEKNSVENTFVEYMKKKGLQYKDCVWNTGLPEKKERIAEIIEKHRKHAYFCISYYVAIKVLEYCRENNISIPKDMAIITFDHFTFFEHIYPKLTGIKQPFDIMGAMAVEKLVKLIKGDKTISNVLIKPELIPGDTV